VGCCGGFEGLVPHPLAVSLVSSKLDK
jgi:hypothetical protein